MVSESLAIGSRRHRGSFAIELDQGVIGYKYTNSKRVGIDRKESRVEELMDVLHQENAVPGVPGVLPGLLKPTRAYVLYIIILASTNGI